MYLSVQILPCELDDEANEVAVVVDVLRATSVMATALHNGAIEIVTCLEIDEARQVAAGLKSRPLLCGERLCRPIPGFDLGNSPSDYSVSMVSGKTLVMTTSNGTRALNAVRNAKLVYTGAFVNLSAVAQKVMSEDRVVIACAGTDGKETEEDVLFAGALSAKLVSLLGEEITLDMTARDTIDAWHEFASGSEALGEKLARSRGGRNLVDEGYRADIDYCAAIDSVTAVPIMVSQQPITLRRSP